MIDKVKIADLLVDVEILPSATKHGLSKEYEALSLEYEINPPELSGAPGFLTNMREQFNDLTAKIFAKKGYVDTSQDEGVFICKH